MSLRDRMTLGNSLARALIPIFDEIIAAVNALSATVFSGENPHKANDTANAVSTADASSLDAVGNLEAALDTAYAAHLGSTTYHIAADTTNTLTAKTVLYKVNLLANDLATKYEAHRILTSGPVHGAADSTNVITAATATTKATAILLLNDIKAMFNAHCALIAGGVHGAADTTNPVSTTDLTSSATWSEIQVMADAIRTAYEAHRQLTAGSVHEGADATNTISASAVGSVQTSVNTYLTELKGDFNGHTVLLTSHYVKDSSMNVTVADATTLATSIALVNALKAAFNEHISRADESALTVSTLDELS